MVRQVTAFKAEQTVRIPLSDGTLEGCLTIPHESRAVVLCASGSSCGRLSVHNRALSGFLHDADLATLSIGLLTAKEQQAEIGATQLCFDIPLLAGRLVRATDWLSEGSSTRDLPIGYLGADTGAAASLVAAAGRPSVAAVVSRGGRPDLAGCALDDVRAAVMLIVGELDSPLIDFNERAYDRMRRAREKRMHVIPNANDRLEEPGALEQVRRFATDWFVRHLTTHRPGQPR
jgi:hypothetical protein